MEKAKKPWWAKLLITILSIVLVVALSLGGACIFVKVKYGISVFGTIGQIRTLQEEVKEDELFENKFSEEDKSSAQLTVNAQVDGLIQGNAEDGYSIASTLPGAGISASLKITDKQLGAIAQILIGDEGIAVSVGETNINAQLIQVKFDNIEENSADINFVIKADVSMLKEKMTDFPLSWINKYVPSTIYLSSTVSVLKGDDAFSYTIESVGMTINNLSEEQTTELFKTLDLIAKTGTAEKFNLEIGSQFVNALIGNSENPDGFAYSLRDLGATDYDFVKQDEINYFVIEK